MTLAASGWTYGENARRSTFVLADKETESLWFPAGEQGCPLPSEATGQAGCGLVGIAGVYADRVLLGDVLSQTTWADWKAAHPNSRFVTN